MPRIYSETGFCGNDAQCQERLVAGADCTDNIYVGRLSPSYYGHAWLTQLLTFTGLPHHPVLQRCQRLPGQPRSFSRCPLPLPPLPLHSRSLPCLPLRLRHRRIQGRLRVHRHYRECRSLALPSRSTSALTSFLFQSNLEQCGACASAGGVDCTALPGVEAVGCVAGQCEVRPGSSPSPRTLADLCNSFL